MDKENLEANPFAEAVAAAAFFFRHLFDLRMQTVLTTRMLPVIYGLGVAFSACLSLYLVATAFSYNWTQGMFWLLLAGPVLFLAMVVALRVILEFVMSVFRLAIMVEGVAAQTEEINHDLPRIQFWKSSRRGRDET